jgi:hypothetical protein
MKTIARRCRRRIDELLLGLAEDAVDASAVGGSASRHILALFLLLLLLLLLVD